MLIILIGIGDIEFVNTIVNYQSLSSGNCPDAYFMGAWCLPFAVCGDELEV